MAFFEITDRQELLATYGGDVARLDALVDGLGEKALHFRPAIDDAWTIAEHIGHLASTEVNGYLRFQKAILNPGATIDNGGGDMQTSATVLGYEQASATDTLQLIRSLRKLTHEHACRIKDQDWSKYHILQPNHSTMKVASLGMILSFHTQHFALHLDFIRRNIEACSASTNSDRRS
jgi:DinB superfamily